LTLLDPVENPSASDPAAIARRFLWSYPSLNSYQADIGEPALMTQAPLFLSAVSGRLYH